MASEKKTRLHTHTHIHTLPALVRQQTAANTKKQTLLSPVKNLFSKSQGVDEVGPGSQKVGLRADLQSDGSGAWFRGVGGAQQGC